MYLKIYLQIELFKIKNFKIIKLKKIKINKTNLLLKINKKKYLENNKKN